MDQHLFKVILIYLTAFGIPPALWPLADRPKFGACVKLVGVKGWFDDDDDDDDDHDDDDDDDDAIVRFSIFVKGAGGFV